MDAHDTDTDHMREALALAERGWGHVSPNPMVGALVVAERRRRRARLVRGTARRAARRGSRAPRGGGPGRGRDDRTAPWSPATTTRPPRRAPSALIDAGVARVVVGATDPNPLVDGSGIARLRDGGPRGARRRSGRRGAPAQRRLRAARHDRACRSSIWKVAASLDGKTAARDGSSRWITSAEGAARRPSPACVGGRDRRRRRHGARRRPGAHGPPSGSAPTAWQPLRVVVDWRRAVCRRPQRCSTTARPRWSRPPTAPEERALARWQAAGAEVVVLAGRRNRRRLAGGPASTQLGKRDVQGVAARGRRHARVELPARRRGRPDRAVRGAAS